MKDKKILFVVKGINRGGIERYIYRFCRENPDLHLTIFCKSGAYGSMHSEFSELNVRLHKFRLFSILSYLRLVYWLSSEKFDTVCDFNGNFAALVLLCARVVGIDNRIVFYRNSEYTFKVVTWKKVILYFQGKLLKYSVTKCLSNSSKALIEFTSDIRVEKRVIRNGVRIQTKENKGGDNIENALESKYVIGHVGSYRWQKNHIFLLDVIKELVYLIPNVHILLVGQGTVDLQQEIIDRELDGFVSLAGEVPDIENYLRVMDLFIFPSIIEGQPNALIEAMIYGVDVIVSDIEVHRETLPPKYHELLLPLDVNAFVSRALEYYRGDFSYAQEDLSKQCQVLYSPEARFREFRNELM